MEDETATPVARRAAADSLLDRGWGKAAQVVEGNPDQPLKLEIEIIDPTKPEE